MFCTQFWYCDNHWVSLFANSSPVSWLIWTLHPGGAAHLHPGEALLAGDVRWLHVSPGPLCGHHRRKHPRGAHGAFCGVLPHVLPRGTQRLHCKEALQPNHWRNVPLLLESPQEREGFQRVLASRRRPSSCCCCRLQSGPLSAALRGRAGVPPSARLWILRRVPGEADVCEHSRVDQEQVHGHVHRRVHDWGR